MRFRIILRGSGGKLLPEATTSMLTGSDGLLVNASTLQPW